MPFVAEYVLCSTPKTSDSIGTTMAYSGYVEIVFTLLFVISLSKAGILSMKKKMALSVLVSDDDENELETKVGEMAQEIAELRAALQDLSVKVKSPGAS